jgi:tRNA threonylcarbamoyl adenosine modification protein (Sua5/YciO/YrdC/YwlC family)
VSDPIADAVAAVERGALVVLPTDTVYGVGGRPDDTSVTAAIFAAKARPPDLALPILVADAEAAAVIAAFDGRAERVAAACWPGALTIVLPRTARSAGWDLGGAAGTVGVRVPAHALTVEVLARTGPLAITSANRSGEPPATTCDQLVATFGDAVAVYLCQDDPLQGRSSTVLDLAHGPARVLREGDVEADALARLLPGEGPLLDSRPS